MRLLKVRIRLEKSHSKFKKSHSTKINSNAIIEKKEVCIIVLSHLTYQTTNATYNMSHSIVVGLI